MQDLKGEYDFIFLDVPGTINTEGYIDILFLIHHFLIPSLEDEFSVWSALELYHIIQQKIKPHSEVYQDCHLFFNNVPPRNIIPHLLKQLEANYNFLPIQLYGLKRYQRKYRSTLFPIPTFKTEADKLVQFAKAFYQVIHQTKPVKINSFYNL